MGTAKATSPRASRGKPLIIVESPTKARTIKKFLPARFIVKASVGHVRDLPKSSLGVDVEGGFTPKYLTIKGKGDLIKELRNAASRLAKSISRPILIAKAKPLLGILPKFSKLKIPCASSCMKLRKMRAQGNRRAP